MVTRSLYEEGVAGKYFDNLKGWTHTYTNIEMNGDVEIEISKYDGSPITKAAVHPVAKGSVPEIIDGKAYFTMEKPALIAVDIDGQMDDNDTGAYPIGGGDVEQYDGPAIHAVCIYAHPIFEKPEKEGEGVVFVEPGSTPPTNPEEYSTVYFGPGVHNIGREYPVFSNKQYFIPGDAILYGTMGTQLRNNGDNIKIYGVGTLSGDSLRHPNHDPDFEYESATPSNARPWKPVSILDCDNVTIEGICMANPSFHGVSLPWKTLERKVTFVRWAKVISWRANGDGIGNAHVMEDCFLRTQDDACYVKGDRRRLVIWTDANGSAFVQQGIIDDFPIYVEDCDVIYARAKWHKWDGGRVFSGRPISGKGKDKVNVLFRDIRIEDPRPTLQIFNLRSKDDIPAPYNIPSEDIGNSYSGLIYQNITAVAPSILNHPEILHGCEESPYSDLVFEDVVIGEKLFTKLSDFSFANEWVTDITFNPEVTDDATLFDLYLDGVSMPEFKPNIEEYTFNFPIGSEANLPVVSAARMDYDATVEVTQADGLPGKSTIFVTAEDGTTTKTYTLNFTLGSNEITGFIAPEQISPKENITTTVSYSATDSADIRVFIQLNSSPWTNYGGVTVSVPKGSNTIDIELLVNPEIELLDDAYKIVVNLLPLGGGWPERMDEVKIVDVDAISPYSSDASLLNLSYDGSSLPGFDSGKLKYDLILPAGTSDVPDLIAITSHENAWVEMTKAESLPGSTVLTVNAEDSSTTEIYIVKFVVEDITGVTAPEELVKGEDLAVSVDYVAYDSRDLLLILQMNSDPWTEYGRSTIAVPAGVGTVNVNLDVDENILIAADAYKISVNLLEAGGTWEDRLAEETLSNIDVVRAPSNDATLLDLTVDGVTITDFEAGITNYDVEIMANYAGTPTIDGSTTDENASVQISQTGAVPGSASILVSAEDGETTLVYTVNFILVYPNDITYLNAPSEVMQGDTITVTVTYSAYTSSAVFVSLQQNTSPWTNYGEGSADVNVGTGNVEVELIVDAEIPVLNDAYEIVAALLPIGGAMSDSLASENSAAITAVKRNGIFRFYLNETDKAVQVFPNPFTNELTIHFEDEEDFMISHVNGQKVFESRFGNSSLQTSVRTDNWTPGVYFLKTESGGVRKLIKR